MADTPTQSGEDGSIDVSFVDDIAIVIIKRGENRVNGHFVEQMDRALDQVLSNQSAKALITTGHGKFYSNGLDVPWLKYLAGTDPGKLDKFRSEGARAIPLRIASFPLPTIALVNGHAFAAGAILALAHDHVIMQDTRGWWCLNEVHVNLRFHPSVLELMKLKLPKACFHEAVVFGRRFTADEAKSAGIVHETCAPEHMYSRARDWVKKVVPANGFNRDHLETMRKDVYSNVTALMKVENHEFKPSI